MFSYPAEDRSWWYLRLCHVNDSSESKWALPFGQTRHTDHRWASPDEQDKITVHSCSGCEPNLQRQGYSCTWDNTEAWPVR
jgi:hypothetical protein